MKATHEKYIHRCLELAKLGAGSVSPNPMVGAVIVHNNQIIGEGYHALFGDAHAEVNAVNSVKNPSLLKNSTIYVSLEPCSHFGKTPPCADLIIKHQFKKVVVATLDANPIVCGNGIQKIKNAGIEVEIGFLENKAQWLNRTFTHFQTTKKPFVILKWAQTADGFIDHIRDETHQKPLKISNSTSSTWVHKLRSQVDAILVGKNTVIKDDPLLDTRKWFGKNPLRVIIDPNLKITESAKVLKTLTPTLIFNFSIQKKVGSIEYCKLSEVDPLNDLLTTLGQRNIQSLLVEGGAFTLSQFIENELFNECYIIKSNNAIQNGVKAPYISHSKGAIFQLDNDKIILYE
jgi:diaminohydroxyphosphoribosylaminopyrimidine deaminase/5-amino-6-(5-phosphoribosylamino)uracil reductase